MRIVHKLLLGAAFASLLTWGVGIYAVGVSEESLRQAIVRTSEAQAVALMDEIDRFVHVRIAGVKAYTRGQAFSRALAESNAAFAAA